MNGFKCVQCQSLFPEAAILEHAVRLRLDVNHLKCPVCGCRFTDGKLGQEFHGQSNSPSIRECSWTNPSTTSPDDR